MKDGWKRAGRVAPAWALLFALAACGDRIENTGTPQPDHPNVEINRQGEPGAARQEQAEAPSGATAITSMGAAPAVDEDQRIREQVQQALASDADLGGTKIDVSSQGGKVTLRGRAPDENAREKASGIARNVSGVTEVDNLLTLG